MVLLVGVGGDRRGPHRSSLCQVRGAGCRRRDLSRGAGRRPLRRGLIRRREGLHRHRTGLRELVSEHNSQGARRGYHLRCQSWDRNRDYSRVEKQLAALPLLVVAHPFVLDHGCVLIYALLLGHRLLVGGSSRGDI